jgi:hypothetical protein
MTNKNRFQFPGFVASENKDTPTHEVEAGRLRSGDNMFVLDMLRNKAYPDLPFVVAKIYDATGKFLWDFKSANFEGVGLLAMACGEVVVALVGRGKTGKVERVIPLSKLISTRPIDLLRAVWLKAEAAKFLGREYVFSPAEDIFIKKELARKEAEQEAERVAAAEARAAARQELISTILKRGVLEVYTADGRKRHGLPVHGNEWLSLSNGTYVVLVESIGEDGRPGTPVEAFQIVKERGKNSQKGFAAAVTLNKPVLKSPTAASAVKPIGSTVIEMPEGAFEVNLFASMNDIRKARANGLNGGTLVAVRRDNPKDKIEVYAVYHDRMDTRGQFVPLA